MKPGHTARVYTKRRNSFRLHGGMGISCNRKRRLSNALPSSPEPNYRELSEREVSKTSIIVSSSSSESSAESSPQRLIVNTSASPSSLKI